MSEYSETTEEEFEEFEFSYTAGADLEVENHAPAARAALRAAESGKAAWQRIEQRRESEWLRDQLNDWDDLDVGEEVAGAR